MFWHEGQFSKGFLFKNYLHHVCIEQSSRSLISILGGKNVACLILRGVVTIDLDAVVTKNLPSYKQHHLIPANNTPQPSWLSSTNVTLKRKTPN